MEDISSLVESYRKRAEEIRAVASGMAQSEERVTLLQIADEYDRAATVNNVRSQIQASLH